MVRKKINKGTIQKEIERINSSREVDKLDFSNNLAIYIGGIVIIFSIIGAISKAFNIIDIEYFIDFIFFLVWSFITYNKNKKIKEDFNRKLLMADRRYLLLGMDINKLNEERKSITKLDFDKFYKK